MTSTGDELTDPHQNSTALQLQLLDWYRAMGVDAALGDEAIDWLARGAVKPGAAFVMPERAAGALTPDQTPPRTSLTPAASTPPRSTSASTPAPRVGPRSAPETKATPAAAATRTFTPPPPDAAVAAARAAAQSASSIAELNATLATFNGCGLKVSAKSLCFYRGAATAPLMIIGEPPGTDEDLAGQPYQGPQGLLLDKMLAAIGMDSAACHITNIVYWRPPGNRPPSPLELDICRPFLDRQVALVQPRVLLVLGGLAAQTMLGITDNFARARGSWRDARIGGHAVRAMVTYHPGTLLKTPSYKQQAWRDLQHVRSALRTI